MNNFNNKNIFILEDTDIRVKYFFNKLSYIPYAHNIVLCNNADHAKHILRMMKFDILFLDNDLGIGQGEGINVVDFLVEERNHNLLSKFVIHSWNIDKALIMEQILKNNNVSVERAEYESDRFIQIVEDVKYNP